MLLVAYLLCVFLPIISSQSCSSGTYQSTLTECKPCPLQSTPDPYSNPLCICDIPANTKESGLVASYTFDPVNPLQDLTGLTTDLTLTGSGVSYSADGRFVGSNYVTFSNQAYFVILSIPTWAYSFTNGISVCLWFQVASIGSANTPLYYFNVLGSYSINFGWSSGFLFFTATVQGVAVKKKLSDSYVTGQWTHHCFTNLGTDWLIYMQGVQVNSITHSMPNTSPSYTDIFLGYDGFPGSDPFTGSIDDFQIYTGVLSAAQVANLHAYTGSNAILYSYVFSCGVEPTTTAGLITSSSSSSSSTTPVPTTSSSSSTTPKPTTSSSSSTTAVPTTSSSSSTTPVPTTSSSSTTPVPTTSSSSTTPVPTTSSSSTTPTPTTSSSSTTPTPTTSSSSTTPVPRLLLAALPRQCLQHPAALLHQRLQRPVVLLH